MQIRTRLASVSLSHRSGSWACPPPCSGQPCVGMWEGRLGLLLSPSARNRVGGSGSALGGAGGPGVAWLCLLPVSPLRLEPEPRRPWRTSSFTMALETACHPLGKRPCEMQAFRIWDVNQKIFYLRNNQLVAGYLQEANIKLEEKIDAVPIEPHTMFLGIHGGKLCLACVKSGDEIKLKLEAVNITDLNQNREQDKRFAFIRSDNGPTTSFESAACPGWFLCTSLEADQPVGLTNTPTEAIKVTRFYLQQD
uniref:Interleukin-1 n=1 Tax=Capra hircus TaxID=9925 RepID=A0A8C2NM66_CAPHI